MTNFQGFLQLCLKQLASRARHSITIDTTRSLYSIYGITELICKYIVMCCSFVGLTCFHYNCTKHNGGQQREEVATVSQ